MSSSNDSAATGRSLAERLDAVAVAWRPKAGEKLIGTIIDVDVRTGEYGAYPIVTIASDEGAEVAVHCFHAVLKSEFSKRPPRAGERVGLKYLGLTEKGYESYRVAWEEAVTPDWEAMALEAEAAAPAVVTEGEMPPAPVDESIPF